MSVPIRFEVIIIAIIVLLSPAMVFAQKQRRVSSGVWGGEHIQLKVGKRSATIAYDCANGKVDGPLTIGPGGKFAWSGSYTRERVGPEHNDATANTHRVSFTGRARRRYDDTDCDTHRHKRGDWDI